MGICRIGAAVLIVVVGASFPQGRPARADGKTASGQDADDSTGLVVRDITTRSPASQRIRDRLDRPAELNVEDQRLDKVLQLISDTHGINIVIDHKAMEKLGEERNAPSRSTQRMSRSGRLSSCCLTVGSSTTTSMARCSVLPIATTSAPRQEIRVYDVQPLLKDGATGQDVADLLNSGRLLKNSAKAQPIGGLVAVVGNRHVHDSILRQLRQTDAEDVLVFRAAQDTFPRGRR